MEHASFRAILCHEAPTEVSPKGNVYYYFTITNSKGIESEASEDMVSNKA